MVPKLRGRGYIPVFVTERKRSEAALDSGHSGGVRTGRIHPEDGELVFPLRGACVRTF